MSLDHVGLSVGDLDAMTAWWAAALQATVEYTVDRPAIAMSARVLLDEGGFRLELLHRAGSHRAHARWDIAESLLTHGYGHVALSVADVARSFSHLVQLGATPLMEPTAGSRPGMRIAFVADPEDNLIELVSRSAVDAGTSSPKNDLKS
jgi:catechol 2,3-dioxygenase-like lactoylglutathione lyase family enzyme